MPTPEESPYAPEPRDGGGGSSPATTHYQWTTEDLEEVGGCEFFDLLGFKETRDARKYPLRLLALRPVLVWEGHTYPFKQAFYPLNVTRRSVSLGLGPSHPDPDNCYRMQLVGLNERTGGGFQKVVGSVPFTVDPRDVPMRTWNFDPTVFDSGKPPPTLEAYLRERKQFEGQWVVNTTTAPDATATATRTSAVHVLASSLQSPPTSAVPASPPRSATGAMPIPKNLAKDDDDDDDDDDENGEDEDEDGTEDGTEDGHENAMSDSSDHRASSSGPSVTRAIPVGDPRARFAPPTSMPSNRGPRPFPEPVVREETPYFPRDPYDDPHTRPPREPIDVAPRGGYGAPPYLSRDPYDDPHTRPPREPIDVAPRGGYGAPLRAAPPAAPVQPGWGAPVPVPATPSTGAPDGSTSGPNGEDLYVAGFGWMNSPLRTAKLAAEAAREAEIAKEKKKKKKKAKKKARKIAEELETARRLQHEANERHARELTELRAQIEKNNQRPEPPKNDTKETIALVTGLIGAVGPVVSEWRKSSKEDDEARRRERDDQERKHQLAMAKIVGEARAARTEEARVARAAQPSGSPDPLAAEIRALNIEFKKALTEAAAKQTPQSGDALRAKFKELKEFMGFFGIQIPGAGAVDAEVDTDATEESEKSSVAELVTMLAPIGEELIKTVQMREARLLKKDEDDARHKQEPSPSGFAVGVGGVLVQSSAVVIPGVGQVQIPAGYVCLPNGHLVQATQYHPSMLGGMMAPQSAPQPQYTAPQPASQPQYTAPQPAPQPQYTAPQPAPQPQYMTPQPQYMAPQPAPQPSVSRPVAGAPLPTFNPAHSDLPHPGLFPPGGTGPTPPALSLVEPEASPPAPREGLPKFVPPRAYHQGELFDKNAPPAPRTDDGAEDDGAEDDGAEDDGAEDDAHKGGDTPPDP